MSEQSASGAVPKKEMKPIPFSSNAIRLSLAEWGMAIVLILALAAAVPPVWHALEKGKPGAGGRVPFSLSYDYWTYRMFTRDVCRPEAVAVLGDSVVWGHYVTGDQTLAAHLARETGAAHENVGLDGAHPAALHGLVRYWGGAIRNQKVLIQWNPLWLTSAARDLSATKEQSFNHPNLVPQLGNAIPCFRRKLPDRLGTALRRGIAFFGWAEHVRAAYFDGKDLFSWLQVNPGRCPAGAITLELPPGHAIPPDTAPVPWDKSGKYSVQNPVWVPLEKSLQWREFQNLLALLKARGNDVCVLVGPYNEAMLTGQGLRQYGELLAAVDASLTRQGIAHVQGRSLPGERWADSSHPLADGYQEIARALAAEPAYQAFLKSR